MAEYLMLCRYTDQGVNEIKKAPDRIANVKKLFEQSGGKVKSLYATLGQYDTFGIVEASDDETMARISLQISSKGNVHIETLRAFPEDIFVKNIVNKIS